MMKFQKINLMLLSILAWSNIGLAAEGGRTARRRALPEYTEQGEEMTKRQTDVEKKAAEEKAIYEKHLAEHKSNLNLDPTREHSDEDILKSYENKKNLGLTEENGSDDYSKAKNFLLDHNRTQEREAIIKDAVRKAARKAAREEQDKRANYELSGFGDGDSVGNAIRLKMSSFTEKELSDPKYLTPEMIKNVSPEEIIELSKDPVKLRALLSNTEALKALSTEQVQAIPADKLSKAIVADFRIFDNLKSRFLNRPTDNNLKIPDEFVDKLSSAQAKALIDEHNSSRLKTIKHYFTDSQFEHLNDLAKTDGDYNKEAKVRATRLVKRLATNEKLTSDDEDILRDTIGALDRAQKEAVVSSYADAVAKKNGLTEEKGKWWLFGNKKAESEGKIQTLTMLLKNDVTKMMSDYEIKNDHVMFIIDKKTDSFAIRILNNKEVDKKILNIDPTQPIDQEIMKFINVKELTTGVRPESINYFVDRYTKTFISNVDLSNSPETVKDLNRLDQFKSPIKEKIESMLNERIFTELKLNPKDVNPGFIKYISIDQIETLSDDQIKSLSPDQITVIESSIARLSNKDLTSIERNPEISKSIKKIATRIKDTKSTRLNTAKTIKLISDLTSPSATKETIDQYKNDLLELDNDTLGKIINKASVEAVKKVLMDQINIRFLQDPKSFDSKLMKYLTVDGLKEMSSNNFKDLNEKQLNALNLRLETCTETDLSNLIKKSKSVEISDISKNILFLKDPSAIPVAYIPDITPTSIRNLSPELTNKLEVRQIEALKPAQIAEFSSAQITKMNSEAHTALFEIFEKMPKDKLIKLADQTKSYVVSSDELSKLSIPDLIEIANLSSDEHINSRSAARTLLNEKFIQNPSSLTPEQITEFISRRTIMSLTTTDLSEEQLTAIKQAILKNPAETDNLENKALDNMLKNSKSIEIKKVIKEIQEERKKPKEITNSKASQSTKEKSKTKENSKNFTKEDKNKKSNKKSATKTNSSQREIKFDEQQTDDERQSKPRGLVDNEQTNNQENKEEEEEEIPVAPPAIPSNTPAVTSDTPDQLTESSNEGDETGTVSNILPNANYPTNVFGDRFRRPIAKAKTMPKTMGPKR